MTSFSASTATLVETRPVFAKRFKVIRVLGEGAAGAVLHVVDLQAGEREVALKILRNHEAFDDKTFERFLEEREICGEIRHPHIVEGYDLIRDGDTIAFTMEYVPGHDLAKLMHSRKISYEEIDGIFLQVLSALDELHQRGISHRDVKLENILVRHDGVAKLSDLGLTKRAGSKMTATGVLLGTAQYFPPEYIRSSTYDHRGDIYSLGLALYEVLTRERWLRKKNGAEAIQHLLKSGFHVPKIDDPELPARYHRVLAGALNPDLNKRFQSAEEMKSAILGAPAPRQKREGPQILDYAGDAQRDAKLRLLRLGVLWLLLGAALGALVML